MMKVRTSVASSECSNVRNGRHFCGTSSEVRSGSYASSNRVYDGRLILWIIFPPKTVSKWIFSLDVRRGMD